MYPLWYWPMVNMWSPHTGFCILLSSTFEYFPITSNADTPFYIVKASRSDRMHQDKTNQNQNDSLFDGVCVPRRTGTSPQLTICTALFRVHSIEVHSKALIPNEGIIYFLTTLRQRDGLACSFQDSHQIQSYGRPPWITLQQNWDWTQINGPFFFPS